MLGTDNVSYLASENSIPYIQHRNLNTDNTKIRTWIYIESCTGKDRLYTHFLFVVLILNMYVLNVNNISMELYIYKALADELD